MRFTIYHSTQNGLGLISLKDGQSGTEVAVLPAFGASLHEFKIPVNRRPLNIVDNYKTKEEARQQSGLSFKSAKLSPFACRIPNGRYSLDKKEYELKNKFMDGSAIHGLVYNKAFEVIDEFSDEQMASLILKYDYKKDDDGYPFHYRCEIRYLLKPDNLLKIQTVISNHSEKEIPVADGWHPYFRLGGSVNSWLLRFNAGNMVEFDENLIPTGNLIRYHLYNEPQILGDIKLDNCFVPEQNDKAVCELFNPVNGIKLSFFTDESYPYLQIFTPDNRESIAIENLSGAPNCFNNKMGLIMLPPRQSKTFTVHYQANLG